MALEPRIVQAEEGVRPELADMTRRSWAGAVLALPVFVLAMADTIPGRPLGFLDMKLMTGIRQNLIPAFAYDALTSRSLLAYSTCWRAYSSAGSGRA